MTQNFYKTNITKLHSIGTVILFGYIYFYCFIYTTVLPVGNFGIVLSAGMSIAIAIIFGVVSGMLLYDFWKSYKTKSVSGIPVLICQFALLVFGYLFWLYKDSTDSAAVIAVLLLLVIPVQGMPSSIFLRTAFVIGSIMTILAFILSMMGIIENNRGNSYGFIYRTDYACHLLFILLIYCYYYDGRLSAAGELGILGLFLYNFIFVGGKTADICMLFVLFATYLRHYRAEGRIPFQDYGGFQAIVFRILYTPCILYEYLRHRVLSESLYSKWKTAVQKFYVLAFIIFAVSMIGLTCIYHYIPIEWWKRFPVLGSFKARLSLGSVGFDIYPIRFFGNDIISHGAGGTEQEIPFYYYLDSSYVKMLLEYGLGLFLVMLTLMTVFQIKLFRKKQYYRSFLLAIVALDAVVEHHLTDISYNIFPILVLAIPDYVSYENRPGYCASLLPVRLRPSTYHFQISLSMEKHEELNNNTIGCTRMMLYENDLSHTTSRRFSDNRFPAIYALVSVLLFIPAFATAHSITTCSVRTPTNSTVLLLPGSYMEGYVSQSLQNQRVAYATSLLLRQPDAVCIISGVEKDYMKEMLLTGGISEERLYMDPSSASLLESLLYADVLIADESLPDRKTVCTFSLEQERVKELARDLHTPVNGLSVPLDGWDYARCYVNEQLQLLQFWLMRWKTSIDAILTGEI